MSRFTNSLGAVALCGLAAGGCAPLPSQGSGLSLAGTDYVLPVKSMVQRRYLTVVRQAYDFSCGSAALATLLRYHYGEAQTEQSVFVGMWRDGDRDQIRQLGFSMLDMKRYLAARDIAADGYKVTLAQIEATKVPGIALIDTDGYRHFVVIKGVERGQVLIGDPSLGIRLIEARKFDRMWNQILFVINAQTDKARSSFGRESEWALVARARATSFMEPLSLQALALTRPQAFPLEL